MSAKLQAVLLWTPRVLSVLFALFLSMFALDVFGEGYGVWGTVVALFMHLIPVYLVVGALLVAWRWKVLGGAMFAALGVAYLVVAWGRFHWSAYAVISGPLFLLAFMFCAGGLYLVRPRQAI